jgi:hypothetical protein
MFYLPIAEEIARRAADQVANNDRPPRLRRPLHRMAVTIRRKTNP